MKLKDVYSLKGKLWPSRQHIKKQRHYFANKDPSEVKWSELKSLSRVWLFAIPWTVVYQAPLSMGFSRQEYWSELPFFSPGDLPNPGIESGSPALHVDSLLSEPPGKPKNTRVGSLSLSPGDLPYPGIKLGSPALKVKSWSCLVVSDSLRFHGL